MKKYAENLTKSGFSQLPAERLVNVDHYDDLIAVRIAAINLVEEIRKENENSPKSRELVEHLESAIKFSFRRDEKRA